MPDCTGTQQLNTTSAVTAEAAELLEFLHSQKDPDDRLSEAPTLFRVNHLSEHRMSVFQWYPFEKTASVLELCADYGAVTGAFLDRVARVVSFTEDASRAAVIRARFSQSTSLEVCVGEWGELLAATSEHFDYIVFVGGALTVRQLEQIRAHLTPSGKLLIATENRNGMKYLAGCRDPYTGGVYDGTEGYRFADEKTYDLPKWKKVFFEAGFEVPTCRYPYPDHRFCETIYSDHMLPQKNQLCKNRHEFDAERLVSFDEGQVFNTVIGYGVFALFSNSFFFETGPSCGMVYTKFSKERLPQYRIFTSLYEHDSERTVVKTAADPRAAEHVARMAEYKKLLSRLYEDAEFHVADCVVRDRTVEFEYIKGVTLASMIDKAIEADDKKALYRALDILKRAADRISSHRPFEAEREFVTAFGSLALPQGLTGTTVSVVDLIADNFIVNDRINMIDYEWVLPYSVPLEFILFRSLFLSRGISTLPAQKQKVLYRHVGVKYDHLDLFLRMEIAFQRLVSSRNYDLHYVGLHTANAAYDLRYIDFRGLLYYAQAVDAETGRTLAYQTQNGHYASLTVMPEPTVKTIRVELTQSASFMHRPQVKAFVGGEEHIPDVSYNAVRESGEDLYFSQAPYMELVNQGYERIEITYAVYLWDQTLVNRLIEGCRWQEHAERLEEENRWLKEELDALKPKEEATGAPMHDGMDVTVVIPTKNGGDLFKKVLEAVYSQQTKYRYEVICVDSGSSDDTVETIKHFGATLYEIAPEDFGHGKTRNFGASKGTGEFIVFITQDAMPATDTWLENFIDAMKADEEIVGGFGIHYAYPDCNVFDKRDLQVHFERFGSDNTVFQMDSREHYDADEPYRHLLSFFSDNNSCLRRRVWEEHPYEDVNFAEDQKWARKMIEMGCKKLYCPHAPVYHSHDYPLSTYFKRYYDEFKSLYALHRFLIVPHWYYTVPAAIRHLYHDVKYVRTQPMTYREKFKWSWYSWWRNLYRYVGGFIGGKYHSYSPKVQRFLDRHISQQYDQINDKK